MDGARNPQGTRRLSDRWAIAVSARSNGRARGSLSAWKHRNLRWNPRNERGPQKERFGRAASLEISESLGYDSRPRRCDCDLGKRQYPYLCSALPLDGSSGPGVLRQLPADLSPALNCRALIGLPRHQTGGARRLILHAGYSVACWIDSPGSLQTKLCRDTAGTCEPTKCLQGKFHRDLRHSKADPPQYIGQGTTNGR